MAKATSPTQVYFYVPNIIGYLRIILCSIAFSYAFTDCDTAIVCYLFGAALDAVDGVAARYLDQCSTFGAVLDMLADRMGTLVLLIVISHQDPSVWGICAFLIVLDIVSHWCQMYFTLSSNKKTHKGSENPWLNFYYTFPYALFVFCSGNEIFIMCWYLANTEKYAGSYIIRNVALVCFPIFLYKQVMNVVQLFHNMNKIVMIDVDESATKKQQ